MVLLDLTSLSCLDLLEMFCFGDLKDFASWVDLIIFNISESQSSLSLDVQDRILRSQVIIQ